METDIQNIISKYSKKNRIQNQRKILIFTLCLLLSFFLWLSKKYSKDYSITLPIKIEYEKIPFIKIITNNPDTIIQITFKSQGFKILYRQLIIGLNKELKVDVSNCLSTSFSKQFDFLKISTKDLIKSNMFLNEFIDDLISVNPDSISLNLESSFIKKIPVIANLRISYLPQYQLYGNYKLIPDSVLISGVKNVVNKINYIPTEFIMLSDVNENKTLTANLLYPTNGKMFKILNKNVKILIPVEKFTEATIEVPVKIKSELKNENVKLFPDKAKVSFQVAVKDYKKINSDLFIAQVDLDNKLTKNENKLKIELISAPEFVRNVKIFPERVEYIIFK